WRLVLDLSQNQHSLSSNLPLTNHPLNPDPPLLSFLLVLPPHFQGKNFKNLILMSVSQLGCLQSLLPLHSAVSSARLTSCLGIDSRSSRSLSQGMLCSANPGV
ncbi:hypothetical protein QUC31_020611, partial [Theobroma cacao]